MRDIHRQTHVREMKPITQPNQRERDHMMRHQLLEILPRLLQLQTQHNRLLRPITRLQEIIRFEGPLVAPMREPLEHTRRVEVPHRCPRHHVQPQWAEDGKVDGRVGLFHEAVLLRPAADVPGSCQRAQAALHDELAGKGQHDDVEAHEGEVPRPLAVVGLVGFRMVRE